MATFQFTKTKIKKLSKVVIMAGGTGGHVFPGIALGKYLQSKGCEVHWLGTKLGLEARLVPQNNFILHTISIKGIRGKGYISLFLAPVKILLAILESYKILRKIQPDVVIGMGGYVTGPGGVASWLLRSPLIIHEQNAKAGMTNVLLSRISKKVLTGFPEVLSTSSIYIGNPVRPDIEQMLPPNELIQSEPKPLKLLIIGGSLGSVALNELIPKAVKLLPPDTIQIRHQTGNKNYEQTVNFYEKAGLRSDNPSLHIVPFIENMAEAYSWADVVLCRAGALTVAELCAAGVGAILVPFPHAVDDHQTQNAMFMVQEGAALCIQQRDLDAMKLAQILQDFALNPFKCKQMAKAAYKLRKINIVEEMYQHCLEVCQ